MIENEGFKFGCPYCSQHIRAFLEHVGYDISCPTCGGVLFVPDPTGITDLSTLVGYPVTEEDYQDQAQGYDQEADPQDQDQQYVAPSVTDTHGFAADEWQILQEEDYEVVERISQLNRELWWECGAAGS
jgi:Zn-finger nucleic acid-binding protein